MIPGPEATDELQLHSNNKQNAPNTKSQKGRS